MVCRFAGLIGAERKKCLVKSRKESMLGYIAKYVRILCQVIYMCFYGLHDLEMILLAIFSEDGEAERFLCQDIEC